MANLYKLFSDAGLSLMVENRSLTPLNIHEFVERVSYVCTLGSEGKLNPEECYRRIESLWRRLES